MLSTRTRTDETLGNVLFFWCIELLCCLCTIFLSVGFFVTIHWFGFECHFNYIFIYLFFFWYTISTFTLVSYFLCFFFFFAVASLHSLTQACISILTLVFCYSVGAVLIFLSDLLSLFFSWHSALVVFFALRFTWLVLYVSVVFSVVFIACGTFYLFISLLSILLF